MELKKIHEDKRGYIYLVEGLLEDNKELTLLETKKGYARGGCLHSKDEYMVVIKGKIEYTYGDNVKEMSQGDSTTIPAYKPHWWVALEDSIICEWGITSEEKKMDKKDPKLRGLIDRINSDNKSK